MGLVCCRKSGGLSLSHSVTVRAAAAAAAASKPAPLEPDMVEIPIGHHATKNQVFDGAKIEELHERGLQLWRSERCHEALAVYEHLYATELASLGKQDPRTINTNENRAHLLHAVGRHQEALDIFEDVVVSRTLLLGRDHSDTLAAKLSQAALLERMARQSDALLSYDEALQCAERNNSPQQIESALRGRARMLFEMGRYSEALLATDHVLALIASSHQPHDVLDVLTLRRNRAQCLQYTGQREEAIATYREVLRLQQTTVGVDHRSALETTHSLAVLLDMNGQRDEASEIYNGLLQAWRAQVTELAGTLGDRHPRTLQAKSCLASVMQSTSVGTSSVVRADDDFAY